MTALPLAASWYRARQVGPRLHRIDEPHVTSIYRANVHLVQGRDRDLLIDAGNGLAPLAPVVQGLRDDPEKPLTLVLTHAHGDHMGAAHEFADVRVHAVEVDDLASPGRSVRMTRDALPRRLLAMFAEAGLGPLPPVMIDALPRPGFDPEAWRAVGAAATGTLAEGDRIDLGDRVFEVLHLPGHSPGQIGLWDAAAGELFGGDAVYDSTLLAFHDRAEYVATLKRLRGMPVRIVHGGHDDSFGGARLKAICDEWIGRWGG